MELSLGREIKAAPKKKWLLAEKRHRGIVLTYDEYHEEREDLEYLRKLSDYINLGVRALELSKSRCKKDDLDSMVNL